METRHPVTPSSAAARFGPGAGPALRRTMRLANAGIFLFALALIAIAVNIVAHQPAWRWRADATKTRAYSLSDATRRMLASLSGQWTIAMVMVEDESSQPLRRQVDEVLARFAQASPALRVVRIDPTRTQSLPAYESVISELRRTYREGIAQYDAALDAATQAFGTAQLFAQQEGARLRNFVDRLPASAAADTRAQLVQRLNLLGALADQGDAILKQVRDARRSDDAQPIPNYEAARSILAQMLSETAAQVNDVAQLLDTALADAGVDTALRQAAAPLREEARNLAGILAQWADPLRHLPALEISSIGQQLQQGEAAIVIGPSRAVAVPSSQLFPRSNLRAADQGRVAFDQRFRGEQVISAAIRSLLVTHMPMVAFVHAEEGSILRSRERGADVLGVGQMLATSGYAVREWSIGSAAAPAATGGAPNSERPRPQPGQPVVWVIIPPTQRTQLEPGERERQLLETARQLIADGEPVLLSFYPSLLPRFRQADPWQALAEPLGVKPDTSAAIFETIRLSAETTAIERAQRLQGFPGDHPIARAVDGQQLYLALPIAFQSANGPSERTTNVQFIGHVNASPDRWLELQWNLDPKSLGESKPGQRLTSPAAVLAAVERPHPSAPAGAASRAQRAVLVGAGGWMLSIAADVTIPLGGDRIALQNPGNHELMLASVAWLAGLDDYVAPSAARAQVARLDGITPGVRAAWTWITLAIMPGACIALGLLVWLRRRS